METAETERVLNIIFQAVGNHNQKASADHQLVQAPNTVLLGSEGTLDSLQLVSLILDIEGMLQKDFEVPVSVANEQALTRTPSPFRTLGSLAEYVTELLEEEKSSG